MPRLCSICTHPDRVAVEAALHARTPFRTIASKWSVSKMALLRHRDAHVPPAPATPQAAASVGVRAQAPIAAPPPAAADVRAQALAAYQVALAAYDAVCQRDMPGLPRLKHGLLKMREYQVKLAYQRCLACGLDPARQADARIQQESRA
jgi:hypothetical protein